MNETALSNAGHGSDSQVDRLELEALVQRTHLHDSVAQLKSQVSHVRHDLDPALRVRTHFAAIAGVAFIVCFVAGYGFGGFFTR